MTIQNFWAPCYFGASADKSAASREMGQMNRNKFAAEKHVQFSATN